MYLRQSTATTRRFGPMLNSTDGVTPETSLTITQADQRLSKGGGAFAQKNAAGNATSDGDGWYAVSFDTTDTDTVGELELEVSVAGALPVWKRWQVLEQPIYDALFAASANIFTGVAGSSRLGDNTITVDVIAAASITPTEAPNLDAAVSSRSTFDAGSDQVIVATNNDKTGYNVTSGTVDTCTNNTDMRGTDNAFLDATWQVWIQA